MTENIATTATARGLIEEYQGLMIEIREANLRLQALHDREDEIRTQLEAIGSIPQ